MELDDRRQLRSLSTPELIRRALDEAKLVARAEWLHAKQEMRGELKEAKAAGILLGSAAVLAICALAVGLVALGVALPMSAVAGLLVVFGAVLLIAAVLGLIGYRILPRKPLPRTQERLREGFSLTKGRFA